MTIQISVDVRNARLAAIEATIGTTPVLDIRSGAVPANCAAADAGTLLASFVLPSDWMAAPAGGSDAKAGTWEDPSANATGTAGHWRLYDSGLTTCHAQGTCTITGGGGDLTLDSVSITVGQVVTITGWTLTDGNA